MGSLISCLQSGDGSLASAQRSGLVNETVIKEEAPSLQKNDWLASGNAALCRLLPASHLQLFSNDLKLITPKRLILIDSRVGMQELRASLSDEHIKAELAQHFRASSLVDDDACELLEANVRNTSVKNDGSSGNSVDEHIMLLHISRFCPGSLVPSAARWTELLRACGVLHGKEMMHAIRSCLEVNAPGRNKSMQIQLHGSTGVLEICRASSIECGGGFWPAVLVRLELGHNHILPACYFNSPPVAEGADPSAQEAGLKYVSQPRACTDITAASVKTSGTVDTYLGQRLPSSTIIKGATQQQGNRTIEHVGPNPILSHSESVPLDITVSSCQSAVQRYQKILENVPLIVTLLSFDGGEGGVVYQNELSLSYWGDLKTLTRSTLHTPSDSDAVHVERGSRCSKEACALTSEEVLLLLLAMQPPGLLSQVLESVQQRCAWRRVLQVPLVCNFEEEQEQEQAASSSTTANTVSSEGSNSDHCDTLMKGQADLNTTDSGSAQLSPVLRFPGPDAENAGSMFEKIKQLNTGGGKWRSADFSSPSKQHVPTRSKGLSLGLSGALSSRNLLRLAPSETLEESEEEIHSIALPPAVQPSSKLKTLLAVQARSGLNRPFSSELNVRSLRSGDVRGLSTQKSFSKPAAAAPKNSSSNFTSINVSHLNTPGIRPSPPSPFIFGTNGPAVSSGMLDVSVSGHPRMASSELLTDMDNSSNSISNLPASFPRKSADHDAPVPQRRTYRNSSMPQPLEHARVQQIHASNPGFKPLSMSTSLSLSSLLKAHLTNSRKTKLAEQRKGSGEPPQSSYPRGSATNRAVSDGQVISNQFSMDRAGPDVDVDQLFSEWGRGPTTLSQLIMVGRTADNGESQALLLLEGGADLPLVADMNHQAQPDRDPPWNMTNAVDAKEEECKGDNDEEDANTGDGLLPEHLAWHDVQAIPMEDPQTGTQMMLLLQMDITQRVEMEARMAMLTETQLSMLDQMFPRHVIEYMIKTSRFGSVDTAAFRQEDGLARHHQGVTVMFMDIVGFTTMSKEVQPAQVMTFLNSLFTLLDALIDQYEVYKVETAGDCYIVAGSLMSRDKDGFLVLEEEPDVKAGAEKVMAFAKALLRFAKTVNMPHNGKPTVVRVGMHTGPVVTGLIGTKLPKFSIFGDTMNTASRMESTSQPGCVQVTEETFKLLQEHHTFNTTGGVEVKGKGIMSTYLWSPEEHPEEQYSNLEEKAQEVSALISHIGRQLGVDQATLLAPEITAPSRHSTGDTHQEGQPPTAIADVTLSDLMLSNLSISAVEREEEQDRTLVRQSTDAMGAHPVVQGLLGTTEGAEGEVQQLLQCVRKKLEQSVTRTRRHGLPSLNPGAAESRSMASQPRTNGPLSPLGPSTAAGPAGLASPVSPARGIPTILSRVGTLRRPARPASGDREVLKHASAHLPKLEMLPVGLLAIAEASSSEHDLQRISPPRDAFNGDSMGNLLRVGPTGMLSGAIEGGKGGAESATLGTQVELLKSLLQTSRENQHQNASNSNWLGRGSGSLYTRGRSLSGGICTSPVPPELAHLHATSINHSLESTTDATSSSPKHQPVLVPRSNSLRPKPSLAERETHIIMEDLSPHQEMPCQPSLVASLGLVLESAIQHPRSGSEQHMASLLASEQASLYRMRKSSLVHHMSREGHISSKTPSKHPSRESIGRSNGSLSIGSARTSGQAFSSESITATPHTNSTMPGCSADSQNDAWHRSVAGLRSKSFYVMQQVRSSRATVIRRASMYDLSILGRRNSGIMKGHVSLASSSSHDKTSAQNTHQDSFCGVVSAPRNADHHVPSSSDFELRKSSNLALSIAANTSAASIAANTSVASVRLELPGPVLGDV